MKIKYLVDADLPTALYRGMKRRSRSLDVIRVQHIGLTNAEDPEILSYADESDRM